MGLPSGTVTFLFTDIEGSTRLLHELGDHYVQVLGEHRRVLRAAIAERRGVEVDTQGDAFFVAFPNASDAVAAAHAVQRALAGSQVRVRMGIHTGEPTVTPEGYVGIDVHRGARICAAGHGGQILMSKRARDSLAEGIAARDLGEHRLKDLQNPEWLFQLTAPDLEARFPPLRSISNTNLPAEASKFIGRRRELDELDALLRRDDARLLTLTGPGGAGKTRLALRLAAESVEQFKNGVFFVPLAQLANTALILPTIAQTLGAKETSVGEAEGLRRHLEGKQTLLVLDNFEHLIAAAPVVSSLLAAAGHLKVVVTSRERLRLAGEHEYAVPPLPDDDAVALFDVRARAAKPGFHVNGGSAPVLAICRRLDGLPLALELAAARVKVLAPAAILARLELRLPVLTGGPRDMPDRQRTLRATIDWSYQLLEADEQDALVGLGVFVGGFDAPAAGAVCGATLDHLVSLHDKSLLRRDEGRDIEPRFSMLETIREYARERLAARGDMGALTERHAVYFAALAETRAEGRGTGQSRPPQARSPNETAWLDWLESERGNLEASLSWLISRGDADPAAKLVQHLWRLWLMRRPLAEGRVWTEAVLAKPGVPELPDYGWLLAVASEFPRFQGDFTRARSLAEHAVELLRKGAEKNRLAVAVVGLASIIANQGDYEAARALHEESLALGHELDNPLRVAHALNGLTTLAFLEGDFARMQRLASEQLELSRASKDDMFMAAALHNLGEALRHQGQISKAAKNYEEALRLSLRLGEAAGVAESLDGIGDIAAAIGEFTVATSLWATARQLLDESGDIAWDAAGAEKGIAAARDVLGPASYDEAWRSGTAMSRDQAAARAAQIVALAQEPIRAS